VSRCIPTRAEFEAWFKTLKNETTSEVIAGLPAPRGGLNDALPGATHALKHFYSESELIDLFDGVLREKRGAKYRPGEAARQVNFALNSDGTGTGERIKVEPDWPAFEPDLWRQVGVPERSVYDLWGSVTDSLRRRRTHTRDSTWYLHRLRSNLLRAQARTRL